MKKIIPKYSRRSIMAYETIEIFDNSKLLRIAEENHPHLIRTLNRAMFQNPNTKYGQLQRGEC